MPRGGGSPQPSTRAAPTTLVANDPLPRLGVDVDQAGERPDRRRVHERVDAAQSLGRVGDRGPARGFVGDVAPDRERAGPASSAAASSRSRRRASIATCAPRCARPIAIERPSPLDDPTTTVLTGHLPLVVT